MSIPAIIVLILISAGQLGSALFHGKDKPGSHTWNFYETAFHHGITLALLYWGGFFN